ncbi:MAG TPA: nucleotidyltransferase family protein [Bryobacteraceae bacterium]|jgi:NDP-sugar pyrophosphorylase family protein
MVTKAVVLAAGKGTRMGALTQEVPKPMLPIAGKPILEHVLDRLAAAGVRECAVITGYRHEIIEKHFERYPMRLVFLRQEVVNGTAGAARLARDFASGDPFLLTYGDIRCEPDDYRGIMQPIVDEPETDATLAVKYVDDPFQGAAVYLIDGFIRKIIEKPPKGSSSTHWNSAGVYCFRPPVFDEIDRVPLSARGEYELPSAIEQMIDAGRKVRAVEIKGTWRDIGRPEDLGDRF